MYKLCLKTSQGQFPLMAPHTFSALSFSRKVQMAD